MSSVPRKQFIETLLMLYPEVPILNKFLRLSDIPNETSAVSKDKCFCEKDSFPIDLIRGEYL